MPAYCKYIVGAALISMAIFVLYQATRLQKQKHVVNREFCDKDDPTKNTKAVPNPIPSRDKLVSWQRNALEKFYHTYTLSAQVLCTHNQRMGALLDGGWDMCLMPPYQPPSHNCLVYSFGIAGDFTYDDDVGLYGCEVHSFDPSMYKSVDHKRSAKVTFHKLGISSKDENVVKYGHPWKLQTLNSIRHSLGHEPLKRRLDVIKMDIEWMETGALGQAIKEGSLKDVRQVAFEIHHGGTHDRFMQILDMLRDLYDHGFRIYNTHINTAVGNHYVRNGLRLSKCLEVHMLNIDFQKPQK